MPKRKDENETAFSGLQELLRRDAERDGIPQAPIKQPEKVPAAVKAGRLGGKKGRSYLCLQAFSQEALSDCQIRRPNLIMAQSLRSM